MPSNSRKTTAYLDPKRSEPAQPGWSFLVRNDQTDLPDKARELLALKHALVRQEHVSMNACSVVRISISNVFELACR